MVNIFFGPGFLEFFGEEIERFFKDKFDWIQGLFRVKFLNVSQIFSPRDNFSKISMQLQGFLRISMNYDANFKDFGKFFQGFKVRFGHSSIFFHGSRISKIRRKPVLCSSFFPNFFLKKEQGKKINIYFYWNILLKICFYWRKIYKICIFFLLRNRKME